MLHQNKNHTITEDQIALPLKGSLEYQKYEKDNKIFFKGSINKESIKNYKYLAIVRLNKVLYFKIFSNGDIKFMFIHKQKMKNTMYNEVYTFLNSFISEFNSPTLIVFSNYHLNQIKDLYPNNQDMSSIHFKELFVSNSIISKKVRNSNFKYLNSDNAMFAIDFKRSSLFKYNFDNIYHNNKNLDKFIESFNKSKNDEESIKFYYMINRVKKLTIKEYEDKQNKIEQIIESSQTKSIEKSMFEKISSFFLSHLDPLLAKDKTPLCYAK